MTIENRVAVITGATGGLGRVVAERFAGLGARLALLSTNADKLSVLAQDLRLPSERWLTHALDLRDPGAVRAAADTVIQRFGRVDMLFNLVGGWIGGRWVVDAAASDVEDMLNQHVWTTFNVAQAFVPHLIANHWGRVIVVSSPTATQPSANSAPYAAAKAAQETLMLTLAQEVAGTGVTANIIQVRTIDMQHERERTPSAQNAFWTTPEEIAAAMLYLCSDEGQVVNGARIPLYGNA